MKNQIKLVINKINNDKLYFSVNAFFCLFLLGCGLLTVHTADYWTHTHSMEGYSLFPPIDFLRIIVHSGYPLWSITANILMKVFFLKPFTAAGLCTGLWLILSYVGVLYFMKQWFDEKINRYLISAMCFVLFIVGPIWVPWKHEKIIIGCGGPNVWHNATNICGRAVGILTFFFCMKLLEKIINSDYTYTPDVKTCAGLSAVLLLSLFAKPSFIQSFAPAFAVMLLIFLVKSHGKMIKDFGMFCAASVLPLLYLLWQFLFYFSTSEQNPGLMTERESSSIVILLPELRGILNSIDVQILVLMFPMILSVIMLKKGKFDIYNGVVWLMDLFAFLFVQFLHGAAQGEMGWAQYIAYFFVYTMGIRDYLYLYFSDCEWKSSKTRKATFIASSAVLAINLLVGFIYLFELIILKKSIF